MHESSSPRTGLFLIWLASVACFIGLLAWAVYAMSGARLLSHPQPSSRATAPASAQQIMPVADPAGSAVVPPFDSEKSPYTLVAFSLQGMQQVTDAEPAWTLLAPGNTLVAQLIERGISPVVTTENVTLSYTLDTTVTQSVQKNAAPPALTAEMKRDGETTFVAHDIRLLPYTTAGTFNPYPMATVEARGKDGALLASTRVVLPVSTEMGCRNCHTGTWKTGGRGGVGPVTAAQILMVHDRHNNTDLARMADNGKTVECRSCHGQSGKQMNLSAALHGFHAGVGLKGAEACVSCHPSGEKNVTQMQRDIHATWEIDCTRCHGSLEGHAVALLRNVQNNKAAALRIAQLSPRLTAEDKTMQPRAPWVNLPDCAGCHDFVKKPAADATAFHTWTASRDDLFSRRMENTGKLRCPGCHGSPHATYPGASPLGDDRDNIQPLQYQKLAMPLGSTNNCGVCHMQEMDASAHHDIVGQ